MDVGHRVTSDENISSAGEIIISEKLKPALSRNNRITVQRKFIFKKKVKRLLKKIKCTSLTYFTKVYYRKTKW